MYDVCRLLRVKRVEQHIGLRRCGVRQPSYQRRVSLRHQKLNAVKSLDEHIDDAFVLAQPKRIVTGFLKPFDLFPEVLRHAAILETRQEIFKGQTVSRGRRH